MEIVAVNMPLVKRDEQLLQIEELINNNDLKFDQEGVNKYLTYIRGVRENGTRYSANSYNKKISAIKNLKDDIDRLINQKVAITDFRAGKGPSQREKGLDEILHDLSFIVARYADITEDGDFIAKPLNEIQ